MRAEPWMMGGKGELPGEDCGGGLRQSRQQNMTPVVLGEQPPLRSLLPPPDCRSL